MFRGKESSNRIKLSQLVQDLLNFGVLGSLQLWGGGRWVGGHGGCPHTHTHARTCTHTHLYMYRNCKWPPTWRHPCLACLTCMCIHACVRVCACVHGTSSHTPIPIHTPIHPSATPQGGGPPESLKFNNTSTYQDISIPFEDLKFVTNSPPMSGCVVWWMGGWLGGLMGGVRSNH